jgi:prophage tail gpP-like protein
MALVQHYAVDVWAEGVHLNFRVIQDVPSSSPKRGQSENIRRKKEEKRNKSLIEAVAFYTRAKEKKEKEEKEKKEKKEKKKKMKKMKKV